MPAMLGVATKIPAIKSVIRDFSNVRFWRKADIILVNEARGLLRQEAGHPGMGPPDQALRGNGGCCAWALRRRVALSG